MSDSQFLKNLSKSFFYDAVFAIFETPYNVMDRKELFNRCVLGDRKAQGILYSTYRDGMRRVVFGVLGDVPEVDDVLHDGFLIIFSTIANVRDPERLTAWMATLMRRLAVKVRHDSNRIPQVNVDDELNSVVAAEEDDEPASLGWEKLSELIDRLPDGYGRVFRLAVLDGMTHKEIGNLLGINERSSSSQLFRAKKLLRRFIIEYRNALGIFMTILTLGVLLLLLPISEKSQNELITGIASEENQGVPEENQGVKEEAMAVDGSDSSVDSGQGESSRQKIGPACSGLRPFVAKNIQSSDDSVGIDEGTGKENPDENDVDLMFRAQQPEDGQQPGQSERSDTTSIPIVPIDNEHEDILDYKLMAVAAEKRNPWGIVVRTEGSYNKRSSDIGTMLIPSDQSSNDPWIETEVRKSVRWYMPVVAQIEFSYKLSDRWSLSAGVRYTYLRGDSILTSEFRHREAEMKIHSIGIPVKATYRLFNKKNVSVYLTGGFGVDIPIGGSKHISDTGLDNSEARTWSETLRTNVRFSTDWGLGIGWHFAPHTEIFAEPSFRYYFPTLGTVPTIWSEHPCVFTLPVGIRFTW